MQRGRNTFIHPSVQVLGRAHLAIGANTVVGQDCWYNVNDRSTARRSISIGSDCFVGRRNFFSCGAEIKLGDFVLTTNDCYFLGSTHLTDDPTKPVITTGTSSTDVISVGANSFVGAGTRIVGHVAVGHGAVIGAGSVVTRDIPPFSQAHGNPAIVTKRYSFLQRQWVPANRFSMDDEAAIPSEADYVRQLRACGVIRMPYLAAGADMGNC